VFRTYVPVTDKMTMYTGAKLAVSIPTRQRARWPGVRNQVGVRDYSFFFPKTSIQTLGSTQPRAQRKPGFLP